MRSSLVCILFAKLTYGGATGVIPSVPPTASMAANTKPVAAPVTTHVPKAPVGAVLPQATRAALKAESLDDIKAQWNELTHEVSRRMMALATYLQEGSPCEFKEGRLGIGFSKANTFAKDCLSSKENLKFLEELFSEKLNASITVNLKTVEKAEDHIKQQEPVVRSALQTFGGKVVKEWPNSQK